MGLFDLFSKKDAHPTPDNPEAHAAPAPLDEATKAFNDAAKQVSEAIKPLSDAAKPIGEAAKTHGKAFIADVSAASRDLGASLREAASPAPTSASTVNPSSSSISTEESTAPEPAHSPLVTEVTSTSSSSPVTPLPSETSPVVSHEASSTSTTPVVTPSAPSDFDEQAVAWAPVESVPFSSPPSGETTSTTPTQTSGAPASEVLVPIAVAPVVPIASTTAVPVEVAPATSVAPASLDAEGNLEEFIEPLPQLAPSPLEVGAKVALFSEGDAPVEVSVADAPEARGALNIYRAQWGDGTFVSLREAGLNSEAATRLEREAAARRATDSPQIPAPVALGTYNERVYLADALGQSDSTFASQLESNAPLADQISTLTQTSAALSQLHKAGFVHAAVRPEAIILGKPVRLSGFESLSPVGQKSESATSFPGYGAPEIVAGEPLDARTDVYALGALLHRVVTGEGVPETGFDEATFAPQMLLPGVPQILAKTLGPAATRYPDMSALHRDLVRLRARVRPLARFDSAGATTIGLESGRTTNQDAWGELRGQREGEDGSVEWTAWVVSDGMGGMASGEVASQTAVAAVLHEAALWGAAFDGTLSAEADQAMLVKTWTREANRLAVEAMNKIGARGGCTLVCGLVVDHRLTLAHVGDCRTYLWRGGELTQITRDHSYVMSLVLQGEITREQMRDHPDRSKITRSLGDRHPFPDYFVDGLEVETKNPTLTLQKDDVLLAFSDGVWEPVVEDEMKRVLLASSSLEEAAHELIDCAMRAGGPDNATAYLLRMSESAPVVVRAVSQ